MKNLVSISIILKNERAAISVSDKLKRTKFELHDCTSHADEQDTAQRLLVTSLYHKTDASSVCTLT